MKTESKFKCPLCGEPMESVKDDTGVMVICRNPCVSTCHENVFGHGNNEQKAYVIACEKFKKTGDIGLNGLTRGK